MASGDLTRRLGLCLGGGLKRMWLSDGASREEEMGRSGKRKYSSSRPARPVSLNKENQPKYSIYRLISFCYYYYFLRPQI